MKLLRHNGIPSLLFILVLIATFGSRCTTATVVSLWRESATNKRRKGYFVENSDSFIYDAVRWHTNKNSKSSFPRRSLSAAEGTASLDIYNMTDSSHDEVGTSSSAMQLVNRVKMWPPWPLSLLQHRKSDKLYTTNDDADDESSINTRLKNNNNNNNNNNSKNNNKHNNNDNQVTKGTNMYPSAAVIAWKWCSQRTKIGIRQLQEVGSSLWFHLPPTMPPLLLIASFPRKMVIDTTTDAGSTKAVRRKMIPLFKDPFVRTLVLSGFGIAILSWAHQEVHRKRKLTPLPLALQYQRSVSRVFLPPFLPELVPEPEIEALQQTSTTTATTTTTTTRKQDNMDQNDDDSTISNDDDDEEEDTNTSTYDDDDDDDNDDDPSQIFSMLNPGLRKHLSDLYDISPLLGGTTMTNNNNSKKLNNNKTNQKNPLRRRGWFQEWQRKRLVRKREAAKIRRATIFDELVALQAIKRKQQQQQQQRQRQQQQQQDLSGRSRGKYNLSSGERRINDKDPLGYALVTGASQGIGRALAVELARWEIPLVLVARDLDRLTALAYDLEACYGVQCCVLKADLSQSDAAERIHEATTKAGLTIDILINNAGIAYEGLSTSMETSSMERMIMINTMSFAKLSKLYGQDMIVRGRGRMLMVSSMAGLCSSSPNTALYGATKAFEKSLAFSMSKELEPYGVGVTCIMPGPVSNTQFRSRSGTGKALCWYLPYYPRPAESVAHLGIASLLDGDTQVLPGWQNRAIAQLLRPIVPQRVEAMCVHAAWSPFRFPRLGRRAGIRTEHPSTLVNTAPSESVHLDLKPRYNFQMPPRLLKLEEEPEPVRNDKGNEMETLPSVEDSTPSSEPQNLRTNDTDASPSEFPPPIGKDNGADSERSLASPPKIDEGTRMGDDKSISSESTAKDHEYDKQPTTVPQQDEGDSISSPSQHPIDPAPSPTYYSNTTQASPFPQEKFNTTRQSPSIEKQDFDRDVEDDDTPHEGFLSPKLGPVDLFHWTVRDDTQR